MNSFCRLVLGNASKNHKNLLWHKPFPHKLARYYMKWLSYFFDGNMVACFRKTADKWRGDIAKLRLLEFFFFPQFIVALLESISFKTVILTFDIAARIQHEKFFLFICMSWYKISSITFLQVKLQLLWVIHCKILNSVK